MLSLPPCQPRGMGEPVACLIEARSFLRSFTANVLPVLIRSRERHLRRPSESRLPGSVEPSGQRALPPCGAWDVGGACPSPTAVRTVILDVLASLSRGLATYKNEMTSVYVGKIRKTKGAAALRGPVRTHHLNAVSLHLPAGPWPSIGSSARIVQRRLGCSHNHHGVEHWARVETLSAAASTEWREAHHHR